MYQSDQQDFRERNDDFYVSDVNHGEDQLAPFSFPTKNCIYMLELETEFVHCCGVEKPFSFQNGDVTVWVQRELYRSKTKSIGRKFCTLLLAVIVDFGF